MPVGDVKARVTKWGSIIRTRWTGRHCGCCSKELTDVDVEHKGDNNRYELSSDGEFCSTTCALVFANAAYTAGFRLPRPIRKVSLRKFRNDTLYRAAISSMGVPKEET